MQSTDASPNKQRSRRTFKSVAHANALVSMLSAGVLPGLDENAELSSQNMAVHGGDGHYLQKSQVTVNLSANDIQMANWWVHFHNKAVQDNFRRRVDTLSYHFDVMTIVVLALYMLAYTLCDATVWGVEGSGQLSQSAYTGRLVMRLLIFVLLILAAYVHWHKSQPAGAFFKPWALSNAWVTRSNSLLLAQFTFLAGLHAVDMISGVIWSPVHQYRIFIESVLLIIARPVEKFATVFYFAVCAGVVPFIWFLMTIILNESTMPTVEPQVVMLPVVFIIMCFVVERLCHYRLLFLALEFVQWSRLQREELESLFQCGKSVYGAMFDKKRLGFRTPLDGKHRDGKHESASTDLGPGQKALPINKLEDTTSGGADDVPTTLQVENIKNKRSNIASVYAVNHGYGSPSSHSGTIGGRTREGDEVVTVRSSGAQVTYGDYGDFVTSFASFEHDSPAELAIAKLNRVIELTEMPAEFEGLIRDTINIIRRGVEIFNISDKTVIEKQLQHTPARSKHRHGERSGLSMAADSGSERFGREEQNGVEAKQQSPHQQRRDQRQEHRGRIGRGMGLKRQSTGSPSRYNLHSFNPNNLGARGATSPQGLVVGPMGAAALNSDRRRDLLVKTRTVKNVLDLDLTQSAFGRHVQGLAIDSQKMQRELNDVSFNVFDYAEDPKTAFVACGILVLHNHFMFETFRLDEAVVLRTMQRFADTYNHPDEVPYHSQLHGVDVAQMSHLYLHELYQGDGRHGRHSCPLDAVHRFSLLFGALVHDLGHPGVNNSFLIETSSQMALQFNDTNVLEAFHVSTCFQILAMPEYDLFAALEMDEKSKIRTVMIDLILATDLADHFSSLKEIQATLQCPGIKAAAPFLEVGGIAGTDELKGFNLSAELTGAEQSALGKLILKSADIGHPSRDFHVHCEWSRRASEEFWRQGDRERRLGLPVNPMNDRQKKAGIAKGQMGFLSFLVAPTQLLLRSVVGHNKLERLHSNLRSNYQYWARLHTQRHGLVEQEKKEMGPGGSVGNDVTPSGTSPISVTSSRHARENLSGRVFSQRKPPPPAHPPPEVGN